MANLNDLLKDQGIEYPSPLQGKSNAVDDGWIDGQAFTPAIGSVYEVDFGMIQYRSRQVRATATIRIDGPGRADWFDLDEDKPLSEEIRNWSVQRFRPAPK